MSSTANAYLSSKPHRREELDRLLKFNERRGISFLSVSKQPIPTSFGFSNLNKYLSMFENEETRIKWIREMVMKPWDKKDGFLLGDALIKYSPRTHENLSTSSDEFSESKRWSFARNSAKFCHKILLKSRNIGECVWICYIALMTASSKCLSPAWADGSQLHTTDLTRGLIHKEGYGILPSLDGHNLSLILLKFADCSHIVLKRLASSLHQARKIRMYEIQNSKRDHSASE